MCLGIASIIFVGCNNTLDEVYYSCNKEADKWAKENIVDIQKMTRTDWERISDYSYQKAAYNAFTAEQKSTFWIERIEEIMLLDWNEDEINHLTDLLQFVKNHVSVFENDSDTKEADIYSYKWIDYARNNLNWTDYTIYAVTMSGYKMIDKSGTLMTQNNLKRTRSRK